MYVYFKVAQVLSPRFYAATVKVTNIRTFDIRAGTRSVEAHIQRQKGGNYFSFIHEHTKQDSLDAPFFPGY
jgi:hypothetical protein